MNVEGSGITTSAQPQNVGFAQNLLATIAGFGKTYLETAAASKIAVYQQKTQAKTYNPTVTGDAMRSLEMQRAYEAQQRALYADRESGTLAPVSYGGLTTKTLLIVAGVGLAAYLVARKR